MRQGQADRDRGEGRKREPSANGMNPAAVSQIGVAVDPKSVERMHLNRGFKNPRDWSVETFPCGSQTKEY